jgi:hypothetical protein
VNGRDAFIFGTLVQVVVAAGVLAFLRVRRWM